MNYFADLLKGRSQKYIKRIPKAGGGYKYVYKEHHQGGVGAQEHMKEGAAFKLSFQGQEGHFHIIKAEGDRLTVKHDELHGPDHKGVEMTKAELSALLMAEHKPALEADAKKKRARVDKMKRETPRHIGLKQAERLAQEAEARAGMERKLQRAERYGYDELGQSNYENHGGLLDQAAERAGVPVSRNNIERSADGRIVGDSTPQVPIDYPAGIRKIFKEITRAQVQFIQNRAIEWLAANSGDSPAEIREHIEHQAEINQASAAQKYKDAAAALSEVVHATVDNRGRVDNQQGTIKALEIIAEARKRGKQTPTPTPAPDNFETMPEDTAAKASEAAQLLTERINELRNLQSVSISEDEALELDEQILDAQLSLRKLERIEQKARRAAAKEQAPKAQPVEPPKAEPVKVEQAPAKAKAPATAADLPPKGQRTAEDARRFFGEPLKYEQKTGGAKTLKLVKYERDGFAVQGPASGRGKGRFSLTLNYTQSQLNEARAFTEPSSQVLGVFDTLDEALTDAINQHETRQEQTERLATSAQAQRDEQKRRLLGEQTPRERLTETAREITAPAQASNPVAEVIREATRGRLIDILQMTRELDDAELNDPTYKGLAFLREGMSAKRLASMPSAFSHWAFRQREAGEGARDNTWAKEFEKHIITSDQRYIRADQREIATFIRDRLSIKRLSDLKGKEAQIKEIAARFARDTFTESARIAEEAAHRGKARIIEEAGQALDYLVGQLKDSKARLENPRRGAPDPTAVKEHQEIIEIAQQAREHYNTRAAQIKAQAFSRSAFLEALKTSRNASPLIMGRPDGVPSRRKVEELVQEAVQNELDQLIDQYRQTDPAPLEPITDEAPAVNRLNQMIDQLAGISSSAEERAAAAELPPKGQRTAEDARRFFGTPKKRSLATGGAVKVYQRGNLIVRAYAKEGQNYFRANTPSGARTFPTLDEALEYAVNQATE